MKKSQLAAAVGMSPASVSSWESGAKQPAPATVAKLSLALGVEPQFFQSGTPVRVGKPHFRSLRSTPQIARDEAEAYGALVSELVGMAEKLVEIPPLSLPDLPVCPDERLRTPEAAAQETRDQLSVDPGPIPHIIRLAERAGVVVVFSLVDVAAIDAYSLHAMSRPVIVLNPLKDDYYRQRFDVAHELGHLIMHHDAEPGGKVSEDQANRFAAEFLMPGAEVAGGLPTTTSGRGWSKLALAKEYWGVSLASLLYRARTLGVMSDVTYRNAMVKMSQNGWRRAEPGQVSVLEMPSLLPGIRQVMNEAGVSDQQFLAGSGIPLRLYETAAARAPRSHLVHSSEATAPTPSIAILR